MAINRKSLFIVLLCYVIWGLMPAYWNLLAGVDSLIVLCSRILFSFIFMLCVLIASGRIHVLRETLKDKTKMRYLVPASLFISVNWGLYIWAVQNDRVLDGSLGYYMNPLIAFVLGVLLFREKTTKLQLAAVVLAFTGVLISVIAYGSFPFVAVCLALSFAAYGALKKKAQADPVAGVAVESMLIALPALVFPFAFMPDSVAVVDTVKLLLLIGGGVLTALPLALFARSVIYMPFITVAFFQYISPSLMLIYGLLRGESLSVPQLVSFIFVGLGLVVFSIALVMKNKRPVDSTDNA